METKEITANNRLIAEFMGSNYEHEILDIWAVMEESGHRNKEVLQNIAVYNHYHNSWDWLMSVVEKIESLGFVFDIFHCISRVFPTDLCEYDKELHIQGTDKLNSSYIAVVEFIQWYNQNK